MCLEGKSQESKQAESLFKNIHFQEAIDLNTGYGCPSTVTLKKKAQKYLSIQLGCVHKVAFLTFPNFPQPLD